MRGSGKLLIGAMAVALAGGVGSAQDGQGGAILSDMPGALDVPSDWDCKKIQPDYSRWLDTGNSAGSWKYVGKTYRDKATGELYTWQNWLDWAERAGCFTGYKPEGIGTTNALIGGAITVFGASLIAIQNGSGPKSPG